jgi:hypothetical protein
MAKKKPETVTETKPIAVVPPIIEPVAQTPPEEEISQEAEINLPEDREAKVKAKAQADLDAMRALRAEAKSAEADSEDESEEK